MKKSVGLALILASTLSAPLFAHGDHHHGGVVGPLLNGIEAFKHGAVIYDQVTGPAEERSNTVLFGNALVFGAHIYQAVVQLRQDKPAKKAAAISIFALANAATLFDVYVDGITTYEYWSKDVSAAKIAANLIAPVCIAFNLNSLFSIVRKA